MCIDSLLPEGGFPPNYFLNLKGPWTIVVYIYISKAMWSYCDVMFTKRKPDPEKNKKHLHVQNGLLHDNGRYGFQNVAKSKKKTHIGKQNTSSRMLRQTMQDCNGEVQVMNSPYSSTKTTLLWREGNLGVLGCGVSTWQLRNCKKTRVKLYRTCVVVCKSHKKLENKMGV